MSHGQRFKQPNCFGDLLAASHSFPQSGSPSPAMLSTSTYSHRPANLNNCWPNWQSGRYRGIQPQIVGLTSSSIFATTSSNIATPLRNSGFVADELVWHTMPIPRAASQNMPTRNVVLTDHQATFVEQLVASGRYQNASEVLREGLRMVERRETEESARLTALRDAVNIGITDIEAGRFRAFDTPEAIDRHLSVLARDVIGAA